jgi:hypothetical protein
MVAALVVLACAVGVVKVATDGSDSTGLPKGLRGECTRSVAEWIWCDDFEQDRLTSYFEYDTARGSFRRLDGAGVHGSFAMEARFAAAQNDAGSLHLAFGRTPQPHFRPVDDGTAQYREIYWRMFLRTQKGWVGGGGNKLSRATSLISRTSWAQAMIAHVWSGSRFKDHLVIDPASGTDASGLVRTTRYNDFPNLRWLGAAAGVTPIFDAEHRGSWYCIEAHVRLNTPGQQDGVFELWIDDHPEASRSELNWVGSFEEYGINAVFLENFWSEGSPVEQKRYFDNFVVSRARIGCGGP